MERAQREVPWVNANLFTENRSKFPREELAKYAGQHVAWTLDGTRILASGADDESIEQKLIEAGIDPTRVVFDFIMPPDQVLI